jgi:hypothetical protein
LATRFDLAVPDLIDAYGEREKHDARELEQYDFTIISLDGAEVEDVAGVLNDHPELAMHEAWVLHLCISYGLGLVARSQQLISAASTASVEAHGTLWLLDRLVVAGCLSPREAVAAVQRLQSHGRGLSPTACEHMIEKWGGRGR